MALISTIQASCRDCYKCVRSCPVKAIKVTAGHAEVVEERCIGDGRCIKVCPQRAKKIESSIRLVWEMIHSGLTVAVSLAPSFIGMLDGIAPGQMVTAIKKLGFRYVAETAEGAEGVAMEHRRLAAAGPGPVITSCCPVIVNLIEIYYPEILPYLAPVVSPMIAHGRMLKKRYGETAKVVFIGPCIAKKGELLNGKEPGGIDAVLTFRELGQLLDEAGIDPRSLEPTPWDGPGAIKAQAFPVPGGLARTAALSTDLLAEKILAIDGLDEVIAFLDDFQGSKASLQLVELLACRGGCLAGPGIETHLTQLARRERVLGYAGQQAAALETEAESLKKAESLEAVALAKSYVSRGAGEAEIPEATIREILARTGKLHPEDELNCGACGYNTCREKARAVAMGLAEVNMCIPYMRAKAESRANLICRITPNAIVVVDSNLKILEVNPAAEVKFHCRQERVVGRDLAEIIEPEVFERVLKTRQLATGEMAYPQYNIVTWQAVFYAAQEDVLIGIFADITKERQQREKLDQVKTETLDKAQEVINKQMRVAQEIAGLLGETTAETKVLLTKLMSLLQDKTDSPRRERPNG